MTKRLQTHVALAIATTLWLFLAISAERHDLLWILHEWGSK